MLIDVTGVEPLNRTHDRAAFDCGKPPLNEYLQRQARQHADKNFSKTWVVTSDGRTILGYVTLSLGSVGFEHLSEEIAVKLPKHPMPVLHVGRLAVSLSAQGQGIGSLLLRFAALKAIEVSANAGCYALELVAMDEEARTFYLRKGFTPLKEGSMRLYASVDTLRAATNS